MILETFPGMRRIDGTGALVRATRLRATTGRPGSLAEAREFLDRLATGWMPSEADRADAPVLDGWGLAPRRGGLSLFGRVEGHPLSGSCPAAVASPLIALDGRGLAWGRTVWRVYLLGRPAIAGPSP